MRKSDSTLLLLAGLPEDWHFPDDRQRHLFKGRSTALRAGLRHKEERSPSRYPGLSHITARDARRYVTHLGYPYAASAGAGVLAGLKLESQPAEGLKLRNLDACGSKVGKSFVLYPGLEKKQLAIS